MPDKVVTNLFKVDISSSIPIDVLDGKTIVRTIRVGPKLKSTSHANTRDVAHLNIFPHSLLAAEFIVTCRNTESVLLSRMLIKRG
jgi:hypothetical protein